VREGVSEAVDFYLGLISILASRQSERLKAPMDGFWSWNMRHQETKASSSTFPIRSIRSHHPIPEFSTLFTMKDEGKTGTVTLFDTPLPFTSQVVCCVS
jgi:hypothetical protein